MSTIQPGYEIAPDGTAYNVLRKGDAPIVVLIHGLGLCRHMWRDHIADFATDYQVVSYDLLGHGDSAAPTTLTDLSLYSRQLGGLLDHLQIDKAAVVGFSIGGMINRRFAIDYADRLSALAILNSPHDRGAADLGLGHLVFAGCEPQLSGCLLCWPNHHYRSICLSTNAHTRSRPGRVLCGIQKQYLGRRHAVGHHPN